jgi:hypothetical protein
MMTRFLMWTPTRWPAMRVRTLLLGVLVYGIIEAFARGISHAFGRAPEVKEIVHWFYQLQGGFLVLIAGLFGCYRATGFHPVGSRRYMTWLKTSPWHAGLSLPLGPVTLVWQDAAFLAVLTALVDWRTQLPPALVVGVFGVAYLVLITFILAATKQGVTAYLQMMGLAGVIRFAGDWWIAAAISAGVYPLIHLAIRRSLHSFPWDTEKKLPRASGLGWTFERFSPVDSYVSAPAKVAVPLCVLAGVWTYALCARLDLITIPADLFMLMSVSGLALSFFRLMAYMVGNSPPLTLLGRLWTGRILIPRYDQIFIVPAIILLWTCLSEWLVIFHRVADGSYPIYGAIFTTITLLLTFVPGPSLREWKLTGACSVMPSRRAIAINQGTKQR